MNRLRLQRRSCLAATVVIACLAVTDNTFAWFPTPLAQARPEGRPDALRCWPGFAYK